MCERVGCKFTLGLEAPCQEIRINAAWWLLVAACALLWRGYDARDKGGFGASVLEAWPRTFITPKPEQSVVFSNESRGFSMRSIFAELNPVSVTADVISTALWRKGTGTSRSGLSGASTRQHWEFLRPLEGKQKHFLSRKYVFSR